MSLNEAQRRDPATELSENLSRSGLTESRASNQAQLDSQRFRAALNVSPDADPVDVWRVRDFLDQAVRDNGQQPVTYLVLTEEARQAARRWFNIPLNTRD